MEAYKALMKTLAISGDKNLHQTHFNFPGVYMKAKLHVPSSTARAALYDSLYVVITRPGAERNVKGPHVLAERIPAHGWFILFIDWDDDLPLCSGSATLQATVIEINRKVAAAFVAEIQESFPAANWDESNLCVATACIQKMHLVAPGIIVNKNTAVAFCARLVARLEKEGVANAATCLDTSVYNGQGMRMLGCHKGTTVKPAAVEAYEAKFGPGTYVHTYAPVDKETFARRRIERSDLDAFSIITDADAETPTTLRPARAGTVKGKRKYEKRTNATAEQLPISLTLEGQESENLILQRKIAETFQLQMEELNWRGRCRLGNHITVPTSSRMCEFAGREHTSNHMYIVLSTAGIELRCHDVQCTVTRCLQREEMSIEEVAELDQELQGNDRKVLVVPQEITEEMRIQAVEDTISGLRSFPESRDLDLYVDPARIHRTDLGENETWLCDLPRNRFCPICQKEHDEPQNCVIFTMQKLRILCRKDDFKTGISFPLLEKHGSIIFASNQFVQNNYITVNNNTEERDVRDFGGYCEFPTVHQEDVLDRLCFKSLSGLSGNIARYAIRLMEGKYIYQESEWYWFTGKYWKARTPPDNLLMDDISDIYDNLQEHYRSEKQLRWLNMLKDDLGNLTRRKVLIEDMERQQQLQDVRFPLGAQAHLIGFSNGVFDSRSCVFRDIQPTDYLTEVLPYDLPETPSLDKALEIENFMKDILPKDAVRNFVWDMLSQHLVGANEVQKAMVWTGSGGNGKGKLKYLMSKAFGDLHSEPRATFLTSELPAPDRPAPNLVNLRFARSVFASEPEANKKMNTAFVKFITGGDRVECRACHKNEEIKYYPRFLVTLLCNAIPKFEGAADEVRGLWRRLAIVKFEQEFVDGEPQHPWQKRGDPRLNSKIDTWGPTFMRLLIDNYVDRFVKNDRKLEIPAEVTENVEEEQAENVPFDTWLRSNVQRNPGGRIHSHRLDSAFKDYARRRGETLVSVPSTKVLQQKLAMLNFTLTSCKERQRDPDCNCGQKERYVKDAALVPTGETVDE